MRLLSGGIFTRVMSRSNFVFETCGGSVIHKKKTEAFTPASIKKAVIIQ